jgi:hypothetical protein
MHAMDAPLTPQLAPEALRDSNLSVPTAILTTMRIRTLDGPPLPAEILAHAARAVVLADLLAGEDVSRDEKPSTRSDASRDASTINHG